MTSAELNATPYQQKPFEVDKLSNHELIQFSHTFVGKGDLMDVVASWQTIALTLADRLEHYERIWNHGQ